MAHFGSAFNQGFYGAAQGQQVSQQLQDAQQQEQARAMLVKVLQAYTQQQPAPQLTPQPANPVLPSNFQVPAMPFQPGGVSPSGGGMAPAVGAPGGAGPISPAGGAPASTGIDLQKLLQAVMAQKGSPGAQGYAIHDAMKLLQPQANNALKLDLGNMRNDTQRYGIDTRATTQEDIVDKQIAARKAVADANRMAKDKNKPVNDPKFRALEDRVKSLQAVYAARPMQKNYDELAKASQDLVAYAQGGGNGVSEAAPAQTDKDYLKANPDQATNFDATFGAGAAAKILGK